MDVFLWDGSSDKFGEINFVPNSFKNDFEDFIKEGLISPNLDSVYFASDSALDDIDINLMAQAVVSRPFTIEVFDSADNYINNYQFGKLFEKLSVYPKKTRLTANILNSIKELSYLLDLFLEKILINGPIDEGANWLNSELSFSEYFSNGTSFNYLESCTILSSLKVNLEKVDTIVQSFNKGKPYEKLAFLAAWYLFSSNYASNQNDRTQSILLLHRAVETCFKYWLLADQQIKLDKNGETIGDKHTYLLDYLDMVKKERSISDDESASIEDLNKYRNYSKYAHGYSAISADSHVQMDQQINQFILADEEVAHLYKEIASIFSLNSIRTMINEFLFDQQYLVKR